MHVTAILGTALTLSAASLSQASTLPSSAEVLLATLNHKAVAALSKQPAAGSCTVKNAAVRRDWAKLSKDERREYIRAVKCLRAAPSKSDPAFAPGARTRYDDFVAVHVNNTLSIHGTGNFLTWHRYITWAYEQALINECGYNGAQPYWNWFHSADNMHRSPVFDGSDTSMGGDGEFKQHNGTLAGAGMIWIPSGNGGGCMKSGPFVDAVANIGPVRPGMDGLAPSTTGMLGPNPRCLSRDLSNVVSKKYFTYDNLHNITVGPASSSIGLMQTEYQGRFTDGFLSMHAAGHFAVSGEASDLFSSINDPSFFLHHAMVDHVYWIWQALHPTQAFDIAGTITVNNNPPSRDAAKEDVLIMGTTAQDRSIADLLNTMGGTPACYIYR